MKREFYTCKNDRAFKEVFLKPNNSDLLKALLEFILKIKIDKLEIKKTELLSGNVNVKDKRVDAIVHTGNKKIEIEINSQNKDYLHTRSTAYICNIYQSNASVGDTYNEDTDIIQVNLTWGLGKNNDEMKIYKIMNEKGELYVKNFIIYEINMDYYDKIWYSKNEDEIKKIKEQLSKLKSERELLIKQHKILKSKKTPVSYLSSVSDKTTFDKKLSEMEKINSKIAELRKARNKAATRKASWETTLKELRSLNRTMESGELRCMDCNSTNIFFSSSKKNAYAFDVSSIDMRNEIIASINEKIEAYNEEINKLVSQISSAQDELQALMNDESISLESIVAYKQDVFNASDAEAKIKEIDLETESLKNQLKISAGTTQSKKEQQLAILMAILNEMNAVYEEIDPNGNLHFDDLFTKKDEVYSGSEATIFHLSRLYAFSKVLNHNYPIVVDSFRAEDLSTSKENTVLELYKELSNQVIFTTTLKLEELGKYDSRTDLHHIDYKEHAPSKMLSETYVDEFCELLRSLSINL